MKSRREREGKLDWRLRDKQYKASFGVNVPDDGVLRWVRISGCDADLYEGGSRAGEVFWSRREHRYIFIGSDWPSPTFRVPRGTPWHEAQAYVVARLRMEE